MQTFQNWFPQGCQPNVPCGFNGERLAFGFKYRSQTFICCRGVTTKSPIFDMFGETLMGVGTIRAFRVQVSKQLHWFSCIPPAVLTSFLFAKGRFVANNEANVDCNQEACFTLVGADQWLAVRLELIGNVLILSAA
jgi:hypothetical protein